MSDLRYPLFCGAGAALGAMAAITLLARVEGKPALAPATASSHWLWEDEDGRRPEDEPLRAGVGIATNVGAGLMWGGLLGAHLQRSPREPHEIVRDGAVMGAVAALLDYGLLPRRLSPGWENTLSGRSVVLGMAGMTAGAIVGGLVAHALDGDSEPGWGEW